MMKTKMKFNLGNSLSYNGPLRIIITILDLIVLGLAAGYFTSNTLEIYFMIVVVITFLLALSGFVLSFMELLKNKKLCFIDWMSHLFASLFLLNSSIGKLISTSVLDRQLGQSDSVTSVQALSGVFGLFTSVLFGWLAFVTFSGKQSFPCRLSTNEVNEVESDDIKIRQGKQKPILIKSTSNDWSWRQALTCELIVQRVKWSLVFDASVRQARLFTLLIGLVTIIFMGESYIRTLSMSEQYYVTMTCVNFCVTLFFHIFYFLGISSIRFVEHELRIFDKAFHLTGGLFLLIGGMLMLGATIETPTLMPQERGFLSVLGILNGILYGYIGLRQKWRMTSTTTTITNTESFLQKDENKLRQMPTTLPSIDDDRDHKREKIGSTQGNPALNVQRQLKSSNIFDPSKA